MFLDRLEELSLIPEIRRSESSLGAADRSVCATSPPPNLRGRETIRRRAKTGWSNVSYERDRSLTGCPLGPALSKCACRARPRGHPMSKRLGLNAQDISARLLRALALADGDNP